MTFRKTTKWLVILVLLVAAGAGGYGFYLWNESNERIRKVILARCEEIVPEWDVSLGRVRFDWNRRVHLYDFTLKAKGQSQNVASFPEVVVSIDRERFAERQEIVVQKVRVLGPELDLVRDAAGKWNWQQLTPPPKSNQSLPEVEIVQATVRVRLDQTDGSPAAILGLQNADLKLIPSGKRSFLITGLTQVGQAGKLTVDGSWDLDHGVGSFNGEMNDVSSSGELSGLVIGSSPELRMKLARAQTAVSTYLQSLPEETPTDQRDPFLFASSRRERPSAVDTGKPIVPDDGVPNLGASGTLDVKFQVAVKEPKTEPKFTFQVNVKQGQIKNDALPFPLRDLTGRIFWDNERFILADVVATNGMTRITLDGRFDRKGTISPGRIEAKIENLAFDDRLRSRLPASLLKIYDSVRLRGMADLKGTLLFDGKRTWQPENAVMTLHNCSGRHVKFPYPAENISGTLKQDGGDIDVNLTGQAGGHPATLSGRIRNPGPTAEVFYKIHANRLSLDDRFVRACQPELQKTLAALNLKGDATADLTVYRPPGADQKFAVNVTARLTEASLQFVHFPYRLEKLAGDIKFSSAEKTWLFENLRAEHGKARLTGTASFVKRQAPGLLQLTITARNADADQQLERALPPSLQETWNQLSPGGRLDLVSKIRWVPGQPAIVTLPEAKLTNGELTLRAFPYPLDEVEATFSYANSQVILKSLKGKHDHTGVRAKGSMWWNPDGDWTVRLDELTVDDLLPDRLFRRALPDDLRDVIEEIDPAGPISLDGMVEFRGTNRPQDPVTAAWDLQTIHTGGKLTTGLDLEKVYGRLSAQGTWNGDRVRMTGKIDLDSVEVWDYQFTHVQGPYSIDGSQVIVGSRQVVLPDANSRNRGRVPPEERVTARAIGGVITLDARVALPDAKVALQKEPTYLVKATMSKGRLEQYAARYMTGQKNLQGVMDGWIDVSGRGTSNDKMTGRGQLRINPAALYELPVIVQVANLIGPPDKTAFRYALLDFNIANSQFLFNSIDLVGDTLSMRGRGSAKFDGRLNLDFYSMLPRTGFRIPLVSAVVGGATTGWVGVKIRGTTNDPKPKLVPAPNVDEALKGFLGAFGTRPPNNVPRLIIPTLTPQQRSGQPRQNRSRTPRRRQTPIP
ncbi:MAG: hypothetical protein HOL01_18430 [Planctomycetaceae bacterium]|nr:hypothetical protein [Planctomycetaceae bacterium]MBT6485713.1 hypothetical protein [Planctomycetaceae bacterium]MBT6496514.1 hypothetical protein [Planctomycetaceae bacterium]